MVLCFFPLWPYLSEVDSAVAALSLATRRMLVEIVEKAGGLRLAPSGRVLHPPGVNGADN